MLAWAVYRLALISFDAFALPWQWYHWLIFVANTLFMAYSEGYRGFQKGYSPRLVARAQELQQNATPFTAALAPLYCMSYFSAPRRRMITAWVVTAIILLLIVIFHHLPQPWRGILDAGVVVGLSWGLLATVHCAVNPTAASFENTSQFRH